MALAAVAAGILSAELAPAPTGAEARHAARLSASESDVRPVLATLAGGPCTSLTSVRIGDAPPRTELGPEQVDAQRLAARLGDRVGPALAVALCRWDRTLSRNSSTTTDSMWDETSHTIAWAARARPTPAGDRALLEIARDREMHIMSRIPALVALCRPGNDAAIEPLVDVALDEREAKDLRRQVLVRLPRFGRALPSRLRALLDLPWFELDRLAASALAASGDPESPTLVLETLMGSGAVGRTEERRLGLAAARRLADDDPEVAAAIAPCEPAEERAFAVDRRVMSKATAAAADAFAAWLDRHPEARTTAWERRRAKWRSSARRESLLRLRNASDVAAAPDDAIDVAAASQWILNGTSEESVDSILESLDRVADWLRPQLQGCATPRATLDRMQDLLVPRHQVFPAWDDESDLSMPLQVRAGNCLAWTSLFVSLGDRLGLPLRAVELPNHVFVRWDDGTTRINHDPSNGGISPTDEEYAAPHGGLAAVVATGRYLRPLRRREFVSLALTNGSIYELDSRPDDIGRPLRLAEDAARLDPGNLAAWTCIARCTSRLGPERREDLRAAIAAGMRLATRRDGDVAVFADCLARAGLGEEALALLDAESAATPPARIARTVALISCGRDAEAAALAKEAAANGDLSDGLRLVVATFGVSQADGWVELDRLAARATSRAGGDDVRRRSGTAADELLLAVAEGLLDFGPPTRDRAELAREIAEAVPGGDRIVAARSAPPEVRARLLRPSDGARISGTDGRRTRVLVRVWERLGDPDKARRVRDDYDDRWRH